MHVCWSTANGLVTTLAWYPAIFTAALPKQSVETLRDVLEQLYDLMNGAPQKEKDKLEAGIAEVIQELKTR